MKGQTTKDERAVVGKNTRKHVDKFPSPLTGYTGALIQPLLQGGERNRMGNILQAAF